MSANSSTVFAALEAAEADLHKAKKQLKKHEDKRDRTQERENNLLRQYRETIQKLENANREYEDLQRQVEEVELRHLNPQQLALRAVCNRIVLQYLDEVRSDAEYARASPDAPVGNWEWKEMDAADLGNSGGSSALGSASAGAEAAEQSSQAAQQQQQAGESTTAPEQGLDEKAQMEAIVARHVTWLNRRQRVALRPTGDVTEQQRYLVVACGDYTCDIHVTNHATFGDVTAEACAHWGLPVEDSFLQGSDGAIWPLSSEVEAEINLQLPHPPPLQLTFRRHRTASQLVSRGFQQDPLTAAAAAAAAAATAASTGEEKKGGEGGGDAPPSFRPKSGGAKSDAEAEAEAEDGSWWVWPGERAYRSSKVARDVLLLFLFLIAFNVVLTARRKVGASFQIVKALRRDTLQETFLQQYTDQVAHLNLTTGAMDSLSNVTRIRHLSFDQVRTPSLLFDWVDGALATFLFGTASRPGFVSGYNKVVGAVRFRQQRVAPNSLCALNTRAEPLNDNCYAAFAAESADSASFNSPTTPGFMWQQPSTVLAAGGASDVDGKVGTYSPGGYLVDIDVAAGRGDWDAKVSALRDNMWVDQRTRAVIISFNLYNGNYNLYSGFRFVFEVTRAGSIVPSLQLEPLRLDYCPACSWVAAFEIGLHIITFMWLLVQVTHLRYCAQHLAGLRSYLGNGWNLLDTVILLLYASALAARVALYFASQRRAEALWAATATYQDLAPLSSLYSSAFATDALVGFLAVLRLYQYLQLNGVMRQFTAVFVFAAGEIAFFTFLFAQVFLGFVVLAHTIYGSHMLEYSTLGFTTRTLLKMMTGHFNYEQMRAVDGAWTPLFFILYIQFIVLILVNVFLAILNTSYTTVRERLSEEARRLQKLDQLVSTNKTSFAGMRAVLFRKVLSLRYMLSTNSLFDPHKTDNVQKLRRLQENGDVMRSSNPYNYDAVSLQATPSGQQGSSGQ